MSSFSGNFPDAAVQVRHVFVCLSEEPLYIPRHSFVQSNIEKAISTVLLNFLIEDAKTSSQGTLSVTMRPSPHVATAGREPYSSSPSADPQ